MLKNILLTFIPLFVAVDALGVLPIYMGITAKFKPKVKNKIILQSMFTALILALGFIFLGKAIFNFLGITIGDFMIAGGVVLFCIAIKDVVGLGNKKAYSQEVASVPLGTPLIVGPAVLTTSLILIDQYGSLATLISIMANILIAGLCFYLANFFNKILGEQGLQVFSKIAHLLLAAIAIMLIRKGIFLVVHL